MTRHEWEQCTDVRRLVRYAAPRISRQHLCLVLCELIEPAVARRLREHPDEWEAAWGLAMLRAWCFFQCTDRELKEAQGASDLVGRQPNVIERCVDRAIAAGLWRTSTIAHPLTWGMDLDPEAFLDNAGSAALLSVELQVPEGAASTEAAAVRRRGADTLRRLLPYPTMVNREWTTAPGIAWSGEYVLRIDGREVGDVVYRRDFEALTGERAVAFDVAQQQGEPETAAQIAHRDFIERMRAYGERHTRPEPRRDVRQDPTRAAPGARTESWAVPGPSAEELALAEHLRDLRRRNEANAARRKAALDAKNALVDRLFRVTLPPSVAVFFGLTYWLVSSGQLTSEQLFTVLPCFAATSVFVPLLWLALRQLRGGAHTAGDGEEPGPVGGALGTLIIVGMGVYLCEAGTSWVLGCFDAGFAHRVELNRSELTRLQPMLRDLEERIDAGRRREDHRQLAMLEQDLADTLRRERNLEALAPLSPRVEPGVATIAVGPLLLLLSCCLAIGVALVLAERRGSQAQADGPP